MSQDVFPGFTAKWSRMTMRNAFSADQPIKGAQPCPCMAFLNPINIGAKLLFPLAKRRSFGSFHGSFGYGLSGASEECLANALLEMR